MTQTPRFTLRRALAASAALCATIILAGCGGGDESASTSSDGQVDQQPEAAAEPVAEDFPQTDGKTLRQLSSGARPGLQFAPATATFSPGFNRVAFGLLNDENQIVYAPTAVYVARTPDSPARGPYVAPTDSLITKSAFQSKAAALEDDPFASVYSADVDLPRPGNWTGLVLSDTEIGLLGASTSFKVKADASVPEVGEQAPATSTETIEEVGQIEQIETREPPDTMHDVDFADVVGEKPTALLFATPALCESRVCGPVTDIAEQLKTEYGDEMEFIHQEVFVDNDPSKGLRQPLLDFGLRSEPWLFTVDAEGRIAARLEGSFGLRDFEEAINAALD